MKKLLLMLMTVAVFLGTAAFAQDTSSSGSAGSTMGSDTAKSDKAASKEKAPPLKTLKGTVKAEGDKVQFVADKGGKAWDVVNPEALKGHEGHHVIVKAHVYADKNQIHVMDVKMAKAKGEKAEKSDSMSH
jgi:hypothetical protein